MCKPSHMFSRYIYFVLVEKAYIGRKGPFIEHRGGGTTRGFDIGYETGYNLKSKEHFTGLRREDKINGISSNID